MFTQIKNVGCAKDTREGEGFTYVHQDYVAHLVLLTPGTAVMHSCKAGKPGEMEEKETREGEGFLSWQQGNLSTKKNTE